MIIELDFDAKEMLQSNDSFSKSYRLRTEKIFHGNYAMVVSDSK